MRHRPQLYTQVSPNSTSPLHAPPATTVYPSKPLSYSSKPLLYSSKPLSGSYCMRHRQLLHTRVSLSPTQVSLCHTLCLGTTTSPPPVPPATTAYSSKPLSYSEQSCTQVSLYRSLCQTAIAHSSLSRTQASLCRTQVSLSCTQVSPCQAATVYSRTLCHTQSKPLSCSN